MLFQTKTIDNSFTKQAFPSIVFGTNFVNTYFFSGVVCLLMANLLELWVRGHKRWAIGQIVVLVYVIWVLMSARQNFFMDIATGAVFTHYVFFFVHERS